ncbi:alpha/beta fold hydrolase [Acidovorax sp.]|uniref:alpha/beta fold hydrolase n=1 Tax=Acidovorax sp. TaxID=1872122 RepID=UPI00391F8083
MNRLRRILLAAATASCGLALQTFANATPDKTTANPMTSNQYITANDGIQLYVKDWGPKNGKVVVFSHGWPLNSDSWESQMQFLAENGYRVIAHDRRGHGRSGQPWEGNTIDQYADDLDAVLRKFDVKGVVLVGFSTGGGEVARYVGRHGTARVAKAALVSAITPIMGKTGTNPDGVPTEVFDSLRKGSLDNRSQLYKDIASGPFFGFNRPGAKPSAGLIDSFWAQGMQAGSKATFDCINAFFYSDFREDLKKFNIPTLVVHGTDDQIVPIETTGRAVAKLVPGAQLIEYAGGPHGITDTHKDQLNKDLLAFVKK